MIIRNNYNKAFGRVLRSLRKEALLTQEGLSYRAKKDRTYISLLELGESSPTLNTIMSLCSVFQISLSHFTRLIEIEMQRNGNDATTDSE